jgi:hypothetical protein
MVAFFYVVLYRQYKISLISFIGYIFLYGSIFYQDIKIFSLKNKILIYECFYHAKKNPAFYPIKNAFKTMYFIIIVFGQ